MKRALRFVAAFACVLAAVVVFAQGTDDKTWDDAVALFEQAVEAQQEARYEGAIWLYEEALAIVRRLGEKPPERAVLYELGLCYLHAELPWHALEAFSEAMDLYMEADLSMAELYSAMAQAYDELGHQVEALHWIALAMDLLEQDELWAERAAVNVEWGRLLAAHGDLEAALDHFSDALHTYRAYGGRAECLETWLEIGKCLSGLNQYEESLAALANALSLAREIAWREGEACASLEMGKVYEALGQHALALEAYSRSEAIYEACKDWIGSAEVLIRLAGLQSVLGEYPRTLEYIAAASECFRTALEDLNQVPAAPGQGFSRPQTRVDILLSLATCYGALADLEGQQAAYEDAVTIINALRWPVGRDYHAPYQQAVGFACEQGQGSQALYIGECARARSLLDSLLDPPAVDGVCPLIGIRDGQVDGQAIREAIDSSQELLQPNEAILEYVTAGQSVYLCVITSTGILEPILISRDIDQLATDVIELRLMVDDPMSDDIAVWTLLARFYEQLIQPGLELLIDEVDTLVLVPSGPLWYLPFAALIMMDQEGVPSGGLGTRCPYLIEQYTLTYLTRLVDLRSSEVGATDVNASFAGFAWAGDPGRYSFDDSLARMLEALRWCLTGGSALGGGIYVGDEARESVLRAEAGNVDILTIICAREHSPHVPWNSYLRLFPDEDAEDGRLHARELLSLDLGATEMVILASGVPSPFPRQEHLLINPTSMYSLANTMSGADPQLTVDLLLEETSGQAAWLFPQAFLAAGAGRVLQPVWDVNLSALESLLQIMCDQHQAGVPWGQALRQAQRELIADGTFNDVWFWAPYQLIGRWR